MSTTTIPPITDDLPALCGDEAEVAHALATGHAQPFASGLRPGPHNLAGIKSAYAIALHMHQPLLPAGGEHLPTAATISNLSLLLASPESGDRYNAGVYLECYRRMAVFIPQLLAEGRAARIMLDYSGTLLHGLHAMGATDILADLRAMTDHPGQRHAVEWLGSPWGHALATTTPVRDYRLHVRAWQHHFAALFGDAALGRVRGFSPVGSLLPNHPESIFALIRTLRDCGYQWLLLQERMVEDPHTGRPVVRSHLPHRLVCHNARGESVEIIVLLKTQGDDPKLVGQMQPRAEARGLAPLELGGRMVPPLVTQIANGEEGGVMMNEFPAKFLQDMRDPSKPETPPLLVSEYLEQLFASGITSADLPVVVPRGHARIRERCAPGDGPEKLAATLAALVHEGGDFQLTGEGLSDAPFPIVGRVMIPEAVARLSALFHERVLRPGCDPREGRYRNALYHLLLTQTSCHRYEDPGRWGDYGRELCRRTREILIHDFPLSAAPAATQTETPAPRAPATPTATTTTTVATTATAAMHGAEAAAAPGAKGAAAVTDKTGQGTLVATAKDATRKSAPAEGVKKSAKDRNRKSSPAKTTKKPTKGRDKG
ncbi:MAG: glycosyl hydrolase family 57 [Magnetococcales bacterium]|nr:glycosyl hydrolase family 57 [Magnetococcales bacterium]